MIIDTSDEAVERLVNYAEGRGNTIVAATLRALRQQRNMWRYENDKKQTACEQMGARIVKLEAERNLERSIFNTALRRAQAAEAERDRLRDALRLADAALSGANMNMTVVEKKVRAALGETAHD
jgi:hypothetical protein